MRLHEIIVRQRDPKRVPQTHGHRVALIGLPDDTGVQLNHGRAGADLGPFGFREALHRYATAKPAFEWPQIVDLGDITPANTLEKTHAIVTHRAKEAAEAGLIPVAIGGGHDLTFPFVRGVQQALEPDGLSIACGLYLDAHLDVRDQPGSGMPFRKLIETCGIQRLDVLGLDPHANTREHIEWFRANGGRIHPGEPDPVIDDLPHPAWTHDNCFVSIDLDVVDQSAAAGVSAMNPAGWRSSTAALWAHDAGRRSNVRCFDIMELSPPHDEHGRTARLAVRLFCEFLRGVAERPHP
jgi:formiminoglutamase